MGRNDLRDRPTKRYAAFSARSEHPTNIFNIRYRR